MRCVCVCACALCQRKNLLQFFNSKITRFTNTHKHTNTHARTTKPLSVLSNEHTHIHTHTHRLIRCFHTNKKACEEVASIPTKRVRNKGTGYVTVCICVCVRASVFAHMRCERLACTCRAFVCVYENVLCVLFCVACWRVLSMYACFRLRVCVCVCVGSIIVCVRIQRCTHTPANTRADTHTHTHTHTPTPICIPLLICLGSQGHHAHDVRVSSAVNEQSPKKPSRSYHFPGAAERHVTCCNVGTEKCVSLQ